MKTFCILTVVNKQTDPQYQWEQGLIIDDRYQWDKIRCTILAAAVNHEWTIDYVRMVKDEETYKKIIDQAEGEITTDTLTIQLT